MVTKKLQYNPTNNYLFLDQKRRIVTRMRKQIADLGLNPSELGFSTANRDKIAKKYPLIFKALAYVSQYKSNENGTMKLNSKKVKNDNTIKQV